MVAPEDRARLSVVLVLEVTDAAAIHEALVAEGVDSEIQFDWLSRHGCKQMQGFLFAPGLAAADMPALRR